MPDFDAIIIGTGQAGPFLAFRLAEAGRKVAVVERHLIGGTCVNTGCTPTKTLIASARGAAESSPKGLTAEVGEMAADRKPGDESWYGAMASRPVRSAISSRACGACTPT